MCKHCEQMGDDDVSMLWQMYCDSRRTDLEARNALFEHYQHLARRAAVRCQELATVDPAVSFDDLEGFACIGLLRALERYDPSHECSFETYAYSVIEGSIREHVRRCYTLGGRRALEHTEPPRSLEVFMQSADFEEMLATTDPQEAYETKETWETMCRAFTCLHPTERVVVQLYFQDGVALPDIANLLGVSVSRVSQLRSQACQHIRDILYNDASPSSLRSDDKVKQEV